MITLPYRLGGIIRDAIDAYRRANNIPEPQEVKNLGVHARRDTFLESEFELVKSLEVDKDLLEYIELFPSVTSITIDGSKGLNQFEINDLIKKYPNLEKLIVKGQSDLQCLDVSKLQNLQHLEFVSNRQLHRVIGLDKLPNLSSLTFYDNETYLKEEEMCEIVSKIAQRGTKCNLDVLYMPTLLQMGTFATENISWCESVGLRDANELKYSTAELEEAVQKAQTIVKNYIRPTDTPKQKFAILYQWMCENVKYDHAGLENNSTYSVNGQNMGQKGGANGTVNGLVYGSCVCEGYSKAMQMLLKLSGLPSFDVTCIAEDLKKPRYSLDLDGKAKKHEGDHSILKVNIDGICYYSDVTWDAGRYQRGEDRKYFLMSWNDISKDHKLVYEGRVFAANKTVSNDEFQQLMQFAQERIKTVDKELEDQKKTPQERLSEINNELGNLRQQYGQIASRIETLMKQNSVSPIANYQQQLNLLLQQRDNISVQMSPLMETQRVFQVRVEQEKEEKHEAMLFQIEQLTGKRITGISGYAIDPSKNNGVPYPQLKNSSQLQEEHGEIAKQIEELYLEGEIDLKTKQAMNLALVAEYKKMVANAPRPVKSPPHPTSNPPSDDEFEQTQRQFPTSNSQQPQPNQQRTEKVESFEEKARKKYGYYDDMSEEEKMEFDRKLEEQRRRETTSKTPVAKTEKEKLEEQRRNLRRQQFGEKLHQMGIDREQVANLDEIFREQQRIEQMRIEQEELENTEGFGMHM